MGRPVLIPIALAILLTFLLNPIIKRLQQRGLARMPTVMLGVSAAGFTMLLIGGLQRNIEQTAVETLTAELVARIALDPPAILCIAALPPRGLSHARCLCKRIRDSSPQLPIVVGRWGQKRYGKLEREQLEQAGATFVTTWLAETTQLLMSRLPLLNRDVSIPTPPAPVEPIPTVAIAGH